MRIKVDKYKVMKDTMLAKIIADSKNGNTNLMAIVGHDTESYYEEFEELFDISEEERGVLDRIIGEIIPSQYIKFGNMVDMLLDCGGIQLDIIDDLGGQNFLLVHNDDDIKAMEHAITFGPPMGTSLHHDFYFINNLYIWHDTLLNKWWVPERSISKIQDDLE